MKKVRCPRCSVVNMERFVTFPYCAGCGVRLPPADEPNASGALSAFRHPLGVVLWTVTLAVSLLAIFAAVRVFDAPAKRDDDVSIYGRGPSSVNLGDEFVLRLYVAPSADAPARTALMQRVKLRVLLESFSNLVLMDMQPPPDAVHDRGRARYFHYTTFDSGDTIRVRLRATRPGRQSLQMRFFVGEQLQGLPTFRFDVRPRSAGTALDAAAR